MKNLLLIAFLCSFYTPAYAIDVGAIVKSVIGQEANAVGKAAKYRLETGKTVAESDEKLEIGTNQEGVQNTLIYANTGVQAVQSVDKGNLIDPQFTGFNYPAHAFNDVNLLEMGLENTLVRCANADNITKCFKEQGNANVTGTPQTYDKVPRNAACKADDLDC